MPSSSRNQRLEPITGKRHRCPDTCLQHLTLQMVFCYHQTTLDSFFEQGRLGFAATALPGIRTRPTQRGPGPWPSPPTLVRTLRQREITISTTQYAGPTPCGRPASNKSYVAPCQARGLCHGSDRGRVPTRTLPRNSCIAAVASSFALVLGAASSSATTASSPATAVNTSKEP